MQEHQRTAQKEKERLETELQECQQKCSQQSNEILALKGRLTNSKRAFEKLQAQCTQLEREVQSPKIVKVYTRRSEEERLLTECKKKDELLTSCVQDASYMRQEQSTLLEQLRNVEAKWRDAEGEKSNLQSQLTSLQSTMAEYGQIIKNYECKEKEFGQIKREMEKKFQYLDKELLTARAEVTAMQTHLPSWKRDTQRRNMCTNWSRETFRTF